jgi:hypothetical protein
MVEQFRQKSPKLGYSFARINAECKLLTGIKILIRSNMDESIIIEIERHLPLAAHGRTVVIQAVGMRECQ